MVVVKTKEILPKQAIDFKFTTKTEMRFHVELVTYLLLIGRWTFNLRSVCHFVRKNLRSVYHEPGGEGEGGDWGWGREEEDRRSVRD